MLFMVHSQPKEPKPHSFTFVSMVRKRDQTDQKNQNVFFIKMKMKTTSLSAEQKQKFFQQECYHPLVRRTVVACVIQGRMQELEQSEAH